MIFSYITNCKKSQLLFHQFGKLSKKGTSGMFSLFSLFASHSIDVTDSFSSVEHVHCINVVGIWHRLCTDYLLT